jgi:hypothetical protein
MEVRWQDQPPMSDVKPAKLPEHAYTRIWFWNRAGAQSLLCPVHEAQDIKNRLIAQDCVVWHTEVMVN